ncbi:MAG TPA: hypothetical protein VGD59_04705 [Acidisarcina sp.]
MTAPDTDLEANPDTALANVFPANPFADSRFSASPQILMFLI